MSRHAATQVLPGADIDDKIIARAKQAGEEPWDLSRRLALLSSSGTSCKVFSNLASVLLEIHCLARNSFFQRVRRVGIVAGEGVQRVGIVAASTAITAYHPVTATNLY